jgi:hypothetical protein
MASQKRRRRRRGAVGTAEQEEVDVGEWEREAGAVSSGFRACVRRSGPELNRGKFSG